MESAVGLSPELFKRLSRLNRELLRGDLKTGESVAGPKEEAGGLAGLGGRGGRGARQRQGLSGPLAPRFPRGRRALQVAG
jgi:hypothetical protein